MRGVFRSNRLSKHFTASTSSLSGAAPAVSAAASSVARRFLGRPRVLAAAVAAARFLATPCACGPSRGQVQLRISVGKSWCISTQHSSRFF